MIHSPEAPGGGPLPFTTGAVPDAFAGLPEQVRGLREVTE